ncbi:HNH endonuclease [bacterium]|nr:HNH endonuclease [bacterium]
MTKKRRKISKEERVLIAKKNNFKCGYCGINLGKRFHIDHIMPFANQNSTCDDDNLMAACVPCNLFKSMLSLEQFRREISYQAERAHKTSVNFRTAFRFKQIKIKRTDIVFYFEKLKENEDNKKGASLGK